MGGATSRAADDVLHQVRALAADLLEASPEDMEVVDGRVHDAERIAYLDGHIRAVHAAIGRGVDVRGYLVWSLIDNFEWADGYTQRFGLVHLDLESGERIRKDSFAWYQELLAAQRR